VLLLTVLGAAGGSVATRFIDPKYAAQSTIWLEAASEKAGGSSGPIQQAGLLPNESWSELLYSYAVLDYVVREQRLYLEPRDRQDLAALAGFSLKERFLPGTYKLSVAKEGQTFVLSTAQGGNVQQGRVGEPIGADVGFDWTPSSRALSPGRELTFTVHVPRDKAKELAQKLSVTLPKNGRFITISLSGTDPKQTAATVNAVSDRLVSVAAELKREKLTELTRVLGEQLSRAEIALRSSESELQSFRVNTITQPNEGATPVAPGLEMTQTPAMNNFFLLKTEQEQLRVDREIIERTLREAEGKPLSLDALAMIPSVQRSPEFAKALSDVTTKRAELRALQQRYTNDFEPVKRVQEEVNVLERQVIPTIAASVRLELQQREAELGGRIGSASGELQQIPPRAIEEARKKRNVAMSEQLFTSLRQRYEDARLAALSSIPDIRVLDRATVPRIPTGDSRLQLMLIAVLGGLGTGLGLALLLDRLDSRIRYPEQVRDGMGLTILGAVPHVVIKDGQPDALSAAAVTEALREIRLGVVHAFGSAGPMVLTISSPSAGDGKSFVALNLAVAFADLGRRTVLLDGDIRRGEVHRLLGAKRTPGLTDYLRHDVSRDGVVQRTDFETLHLISSGTRLQNGPELLATPQMADLLQKLRSEYEVIIVDSPPLGAGADPYILSTLTGNLIMVLRTGVTSRELAEVKLELVDRLPIRLLGAVLNDVPASKVYGYYSYLPGYEAHDEQELLAPTA
jgi:capsular exopolysaccharide synthesis family protein